MNTPRSVYLGIFLLAFTTLSFEIELTRIFSVTLWYHFSFMAISLAMFGMTAGAVIVYVFDDWFKQKDILVRLGQGSFYFAWTMILALFGHLTTPISGNESLTSIYSLAQNYIFLMMPFFFSGICISLILSRYLTHVSSLYAADLVGAAAGCIFVVFLLSFVDGISSIFFTAGLVLCASLCFLKSTSEKVLFKRCLFSFIVLFATGTANSYTTQSGTPLIQIPWIKGEPAPEIEYEAWNEHSRIAVKPRETDEMMGWGISDKYAKKIPEEKILTIDAGAATEITKFNGDMRTLEHLRYDVTNAVHYVKKNADVLVIGVGGGRDLLSSLLFNQNSVDGVELNGNILDIVKRRYADYSGNLADHPKVRLIHDEGRTFLSKTKKFYDIIQFSLVDTWAASAAGAFSLTENSLYTTESWNLFVNRLTDSGVLTVSRWYQKNNPIESMRLISLAYESLIAQGVKNPRAHVVLLVSMDLTKASKLHTAVGTILVSKSPFTTKQLDTINSYAQNRAFQVVLSPQVSWDPLFAALLDEETRDEVIANHEFDVSAPTDNAPYFFFVSGFGKMIEVLVSGSADNPNRRAIVTLVGLLLFVTILSLFVIVSPLRLRKPKVETTQSRKLLIFFSSIGIGFMMIELSLLQRLNLFLGHPVYGISVVLCVLLLSSGLGSLSCARVKVLDRSVKRRFLLMFVVLGTIGVITPFVLGACAGSSAFFRIMVASLLLAPIGFFLGMPFALGMKTLDTLLLSDSSAWFWGINGTMSVLASVLSTIVMILCGISFAYWLGVVVYVVGSISLVFALRTVVLETKGTGEGKNIAKHTPQIEERFL